MDTKSILDPGRARGELDFCTWVGRAAPGDVLEYHRGYLGLDTQAGALTVTERRALRALARRAAWAFDEGLVHLVQRRIAPGVFAYLAVRRPRPRTARTAPKRATERTVAAEPELEAAA